MARPIPALEAYTLAEVLESLRGAVGRTFLLDHLKNVPVYGGGPTHRKAGSKIIFFPDDIERLKESLACPSKSSAAKARPASTSAAPSEDKRYERVLKRLTAGSKGKRR